MKDIYQLTKKATSAKVKNFLQKILEQNDFDPSDESKEEEEEEVQETPRGTRLLAVISSKPAKNAFEVIHFHSRSS